MKLIAFLALFVLLQIVENEAASTGPIDLSLFPPGSQVITIPGKSRSSTKSYVVAPASITYHDAFRACQAGGMDLMRIPNALIESQVREYVLSQAGIANQLWLNGEWDSGDFWFSDGSSTLNFFNFVTNYVCPLPTDTNRCLLVNTIKGSISKRYRWEIADCDSTKLPFVCES